MSFPLIIVLFIFVTFAVIFSSLYKKGARNIIFENTRMEEERTLLRKKIKENLNSDNSKEKDKYGRNILHQAIHYSFNDIAIDLINQKQVELNELNEKGETAIKLAAKLDHFDVLKSLIDCNADVNISDTNNISPLWTASGNGFYQIVKLLLQYNAEINHCDSIWGMTPIMRAAQSGKFEIVTLLLNFNPNLLIQVFNGDTVIDIAKVAVDKYWEIFHEDNIDLREMVKKIEIAMSLNYKYKEIKPFLKIKN